MSRRWLTLIALAALAAGLPEVVRAQCPDALDWDGIADSQDNCPFVENPGQTDAGGPGGPPPDGIGDACQCGDVQEDGLVDILDVAIFQRDLSGLLPEVADPGKCSTVGSRLDCDGHDLVAIREALAGLANPPPLGQVCEAAVGMAPLPMNLSASGDSITRGFAASCTCNVDWFCRLCVFFGDSQPQNSWFDGTNSQIDSMHKRYLVLDASIGADKSAVVVGAEMVGTEEPNFEMQAAAIILQTPKPDLVVVELGGNDLCSRDCIEPSRCVDPVTPVYDDETWETALRAGLDVLVGPGGLDEGATIYLLGVPRVQDLRAAGEAKQGAPGIDCEDFWLDFDVCTIGTIEGEWNGESEAERNLGLSERQRRYNEILRDTALLYTTSTGPGELNERGIEVVADYVNESTPSVGTTAFGAEEINGGDCFHPSIAGQDLLSEVAWTGNPRP